MKLKIFFFSTLLFVTNLLNASNTMPSDSLIENFIYKLEAAIQNQEPDQFDKLINLDSLLSRTFSKLPVNEKFKNGFKKGIKNKFSLGKELCNSISTEGHYTPISYYAQNDTITAFFRMAGPDGLNYHEYEIAYNPKLEIVDVYVLLTGEYLSETFAHLIEPMLLTDKSIIGKLKHLGSHYFGDKKEYLKDLEKFKQMQLAKGKGDNKRVNEIYETLSDISKSQKAMQITNIMAVSEYDDELLVKAVEFYKTSFPNDISLDLILVDFYVIKEMYDEALQCFKNISSYSFEDGYLEYLKSNMHYQKGDIENFIISAEKCIEYEPGLEEPYYTLIQHYLENKSFTRVTTLMDKMKFNTGITFTEESMSGIEIFTEFLNSAEFKKWQQTD